MKLLEDVEALPKNELFSYILQRAKTITRNTQGDSWDDPEDYQIDSVELAHAFMRMARDFDFSTLQERIKG